MAQTISILVSGKVQGVYYRQSAKEKAIELNITGEVRNLPDGRVFILATGEISQLNALVDWCWQGPRKAIVTGVQQETCLFQPFESFTIAR